jgi:DNA-binding beta-propeller fold protein YncE
MRRPCGRLSTLAVAVLACRVAVPADAEPPRMGLFERQVDAIGACRAVAVDPAGTAVLVDESGRLVPGDPAAPTSLRDVAVAADGTIAIIGDDGLAVHRPDEAWRAIFGDAGIAVDLLGDSAVAILRDGDVLAIDLAVDPPAIRWRREGAYPGARGIVALPDGGAWIADTDRHRLVRLGVGGEESRTVGDRGAFPGLFNTPVDLAVAGDRLFVADMLNHRISVHALEDAAFLDQWGMHAVVPREGEGRIHYPEGIAVTDDGASAVVLEPFERRYQVFGPVPPGEAPSGSTLPGKRGVESHFGTDIASDGGVLAMWEPESGTAVAFDLRYDIPIHVTAFGHGGPGPIGFGRLVAAGVDGARNEIWLVDAGHRRIARWMLRAERPDELIYDPFMGRFARGWSFDQVARRMAARQTEQSGSRPENASEAAFDPVDLVVRGGRLHLLDAAMPAIVVADRTLGVEQVVAIPGGSRPTQLACREDGGWLVLDADAAEVIGVSAEGEVDRRIDLAALGIVLPFGIVEAGDLVVVSDRATDRLLSIDARGEIVATAGETGAWDGALWRPAGLAAIPWKDGGTIVAVVDQGNHRAQGFDPATGEWRVTFSLGQGHDQIRLRREDFEPPAGPPSSAVPESVK